MSRLTLLINFSVFCLCVWMSGCALFTASDKLKRSDDFKVVAPANWKEHDAGKSDKAYRLPSGNFVTATGSCDRHSDVSLRLLTRHRLIGFRQIRMSSQRSLSVGKNKGLLSSLKAKYQKKNIYLQLFVLRQDSCVFDFTLLSNRKPSKKELVSFLKFVDSFEYGKD